MSTTKMLATAALAVGAMLPTPGANARTLTTLYTFTGGADGGYPWGTLIYRNNMLYGTATVGGSSMNGTIFALNPETGVESVLFNFSPATGQYPSGDLLLAGGRFYGTTVYGVGSNPNGALYEFNPAKGNARTLYNFQGDPDGKWPWDRLVYGNGMLYGTTRTGGASNYGTVFSIDPRTRAETVLYSFTAQIGETPSILIYEGGMLYGVAGEGGPFGGDGFGTVFKVNPGTGAATVVYAFTDGADGAGPIFLTSRDGTLYAITGGEVTSNGTVLSVGTIDSINPQTGALTVLYSFPANGDDGGSPNSLSIHAGALYGTTFFGGDAGSGGVTECIGSGCGTLFKLDLATGAETLLHKFTGKADGAFPVGFAYEGDAFYGTTSHGGDLSACNVSGLSGCGTVFKFTP